jgi:hypothetical protein
MDEERTYSISGLSEVTGIDRRTLKKRLTGLPVAEERSIGNGRIEKRWRLSDAKSYLELQAAGFDAAHTWQSGQQMFKTFTGTELFPKLVSHPHYWGGLSGFARAELGMSKTDSLDFVCKITLLVMSTLGELFADPKMAFTVEGVPAEWTNAKNSRSTDAYLAKHWPDKPKRKAA